MKENIFILFLFIFFCELKLYSINNNGAEIFDEENELNKLEKKEIVKIKISKKKYYFDGQIGVISPHVKIKINDEEVNEYETNLPVNCGMSVSFKKYSLSLVLPSKQGVNENGYSWGFFFNNKKWAINLVLEKTTAFEEREDFFSSGDIESKSKSIYAYYAFSDDYTLEKSPLNFPNEHRGGSWLIFSSISKYSFGNVKGIINSQSKFDDFNSTSSITFGLIGGYGYLFFAKNGFFIDGKVLLGPNFHKTFVKRLDGKEDGINGIKYSFYFNFHMGFNLASWTFGVDAFNLAQSYKINERTDLSYETVGTKFYVGYKF